MAKAPKIFILIISFLLVSFLSYQVGIFVGQENILRTPPSEMANPTSKEIEEKVDFSVFWEAWRKLERDFFLKDKIDYQKMVYGAIKGMTEALEDPYTTFFNPEKTEEFDEELSGKYEGVGMEIAIKEERITVVSPLEGTPAEKAGLRPGDKILEIEKTSTRNMSLDEAVSLIRGEAGTEVNLLIGRESWPEPKSITLTRKLIKIPTIKLELLEEGQIAYLKIHQFNRILLTEFRKVESEILVSGAKKIILDLRNNPGGYLDVAEDFAGWFLESGDIVVWEDFGENKERKPYKARGPAKFSQYPLVVLINQGSASGSEIVAGALRDNKGVKLIGEKSFGKGSVQEQIYLKDDSSLKITIAKWLTPKGTSINEEGLVPDIEVELTEEDWNSGKDPQLDKAVEIIKDL